MLNPLSAILLRLSALLCAMALVGCTESNPTSMTAIPTADDSSIRELDSGRIRGFANAAGGHSWLGIPYAAPPQGELRWRAPQAPMPWDETRDMLQAGAPCIQFGSALGGVGNPGSRQGSEDCLYLNVYAPKVEGLDPSTRLPVMVWIHGGGNTIGHAAFWEGRELAARENVLVVMINYRLGPFGWFATPASDGDSSEDRSGNYGTLDTIAALRWVQRNARAFGGDPDNVTVFGESAGGTNALALMIAPSATGLFHRLIIQSLGFGFTAHDDPIPQQATQRAVRHALKTSGPASNDEAVEAQLAAMTSDAQAALLRSLDPWTLYASYGSANIDINRIPTVFQDGTVLRRGDLLQLLADPATHHDVPIILGTNRDEPKIFMAFDPRHVRQAFGLPIGLRDAAAYDREARYRSLLWKADGVDSLAGIFASYGAAAWAYRWDWDEQGTAFGVVDLSRIVGAAHGLEIPFVLGHFDLGPQSRLLFNERNAAGRLELSRRMMGYWAEFARSGRPDRGGLADSPEWLPWSDAPTTPKRLLFDTATDGGVRMSSERVLRADVLRLIDSENLDPQSRCAAFRATFRTRVDSWADEQWQTLKQRTGCTGERVTRGR